VRARTINDEMKLAASHALACLAKEPVTGDVLKVYQLDHLEFGPDYVVPKPFDKRVCLWEAPAVAKAAIDSGVARITSLDMDAYKQTLTKRLLKK
jgi:malate dehydrogenase (oxaloacetate-decarboxylating)(NADP+)